MEEKMKALYATNVLELVKKINELNIGQKQIVEILQLNGQIVALYYGK